jgi:HPt (histidine-containing phosphotransfer) domain-containing protein
VRQAAHAIKGAAANVSGSQIRALAARLEQLGGSGDLNPAGEIFEELVASFVRSRASMDEFCRSVDGW